MEAATLPTRQRVMTLTWNWDRHCKAAHDALGRCSQYKLTSTYLAADDATGASASLAEAALEAKMAAAHGELTTAVDGLAATLAGLRKLTAKIAAPAPDEPYAAVERRSILGRAAELAGMYEKQLHATRLLADDVLWCDDRDTHAVYGTVLLLQPYVEKDFLSNLRETCELNGDIIKPGKPQNDDRRRTL